MMNDLVEPPVESHPWIKKWRSILSAIYRFLFFPVFSPQHCKRESRFTRKTESIRDVKGRWYLPSKTSIRRVLLGVSMRLLATPLVLIICLTIIVYASTHPTPRPVNITPDVMGLYYENVQFASTDKTMLHGWYIPSLKAEDVIVEGDKVLRQKRPGVVLCHGLGANRAQLLALAGSLYYQGFELLLFDFRACGESDGSTRTFGIVERDDVLAAVRFLQNRPRVDSQHIAVVGQGSGAAAALAAAAVNPEIRAIVAADLDTSFQRAVARKMGENTFLPPELCAATFVWGCQTYFHVSDPHFNVVHYADMLGKQQQMLLFYRPRNASLSRSAMELGAAAKDRIQIKPIDSITSCLLTDMENVTPDICQFLVNRLGS